MALFLKKFANTLGVLGNGLYFDLFLMLSPYIMALFVQVNKYSRNKVK